MYYIQYVPLRYRCTHIFFLSNFFLEFMIKNLPDIFCEGESCHQYCQTECFYGHRCLVRGPKQSFGLRLTGPWSDLEEKNNNFLSSFKEIVVSMLTDDMNQIPPYFLFSLSNIQKNKTGLRMAIFAIKSFSCYIIWYLSYL